MARLSFVGDKRPDGRPGPFFWNVEATGDILKDDAHGQLIAHELLECMNAYRDETAAAFFLQLCVADMALKGSLGAVEQAFLARISCFARAGHSISRQLHRGG